jgi:hypothetical protein
MNETTLAQVMKRIRKNAPTTQADANASVKSKTTP